MSISRVKCHVFVDFDGTIVPQDATDTLLERFAEPSWLEVEAEWKAGKIGSRECLSRQAALIRATPAELDAAIADISVDPGFAGFVAFCQSKQIGISVLSDGFDRAVKGVLRRAGIELHSAANHLAHRGENRWELEFPFRKQACISDSGNCKCAAAMGIGAPATIMVGDGRSDFCVSARTTFVLAKGALARHCETNNIPHGRFEVFDEATQLLTAWLGEQGYLDVPRVAEEAASRFRRRSLGKVGA